MNRAQRILQLATNASLTPSHFDAKSHESTSVFNFVDEESGIVEYRAKVSHKINETSAEMPLPDILSTKTEIMPDCDSSGTTYISDTYSDLSDRLGSMNDLFNSLSEYEPSDLSEDDSSCSGANSITEVREGKCLDKTETNNSNMHIPGTNVLHNKPCTSQATFKHAVLLEDTTSTSKMFENKSEKSIRKNERTTETSTNLEQLNITLPKSMSYDKKPSARERPTICPICFKDVITHFTRHLFRHHPDNKEVYLIKSLKPKSKERMALVAALRKQGYFILKTEKNITRPVKSSKKPEPKYFVCSHCLGHYTKDFLCKHVKICKNKSSSNTKNCLSASQTFMAMVNVKNSNFLKNARIKDEVFSIMRPDEISETVKNDTLICMYGEALLSKHKRKQIINVVSNKMRELGRLLLTLKKSYDIKNLFDALKPELFNYLILATKEISGYSVESKSFKSPSLALHMRTTLKMVCDIAHKLVLEKKRFADIEWIDQKIKKTEIKDVKKLIEGHWCNELSSLALKTLKEKHWEKPLQLPLASDIKLFNDYLNKLSAESFKLLQENTNVRSNYKKLTECILAKTVIFNRKRVGDVQYLKVETYGRNYDTLNQESFTEALTEVEKIIYKRHRRVVTGGKGSKPVPILFSTQTQKYISLLLKVRQETNVVPKTNPYLFANPDSKDRWMSGANTIRKIAINCGAKHPELLTSTRFRKQIATTLQLLALDDDEMEQIATFMGHTKKTHTEFYRLPQDIYQTAKVAKILLLMDKGKGTRYRGKKLSEINIDDNEYCSSEYGSDEEPTMQTVLKRVTGKIKKPEGELDTRDPERYVDQSTERDQHTEYTSSRNYFKKAISPPQESNEKNSEEELPTKKTKESSRKSIPRSRSKWSENEKRVLLEYFGDHIEKKITPRKHECEELVKLHPNVFKNKNWIQIKAYAYNTLRK